MSHRGLATAALASILALAGHAFAEGSHDWSYAGDTRPEHWSELSPDYALCASGRFQSPIDISSAAQTRFKGLEFDYRAARMVVRNTGHTIQVPYEPGSTLISGNKAYELKQFHIHSPSEHTIDGQAFPMELHFVHRAEDGALAVVAVLVRHGAHHMGLHRLNTHLPKDAGRTNKPSRMSVQPRDFLPRDKNFIRYIGSLTTPPCSEGVQWHVMAEPIEASQHQFDAFLHVVGANARPVQRIADRLILRSISHDHPAAPTVGGQDVHDHGPHADSHY